MIRKVSLHQRIEIAFWIVWVFLLKGLLDLRAFLWNRKKHHSQRFHLTDWKIQRQSLPLFIFIFTIPALLAGVGFYIQRYPISFSKQKNLTSIPLTRPLQDNILWIEVDDLESKTPALESAWWILNPSPEPKLTFISLYPATSDSNQTFSNQIARSFEITADYSLAQSFQDQLTANDIWWTYLAIIDRQGITILADLIGDSSVARDQPSFFEAFCHNRNDWLHTVNPVDALQSLEKYAYHNIKSDQIISNWARLRLEPNKLSCEFLAGPILSP